MSVEDVPESKKVDIEIAAVSGVEVGRMVHNYWVDSVAFSPDGAYVVSGSDDGTARIWIWNPDDLKEAVCAILPRNLSREGWSLYLSDLPFQAVCPELPLESEIVSTQ